MKKASSNPAAIMAAAGTSSALARVGFTT